ncbi:MAG: hypothetical protein CME06_05635 [Gemmatimonadetes bacterium]|nr:hypothetical protein [Gemmatimonadota bacterium]
MADLRLLRSFLEVIECGAITSAARRLYITQPALSRRLQQLEAEFGAPLLERTARGIAPTEQGRYIEREARLLVERWEAMHEGVLALSNLEAGVVRVGGGATAISFLLPEAIAKLQRAHPGVIFKVKEAGSRDIERDVLEERLELGIVTQPVSSEDFELTPLQRDRIVLVAASDHPLARRKRIPVSELDGQDVVAFEAPSAIRRLIDDALRAAGVRVKVVMELRSIPAILRMVETTHRLAFVSQLGVGQGGDGIRVLSVSGLRITRGLAVIRKRDRPLSPAAAAFARLLRGEGRVSPDRPRSDERQ